MQRKNFPVKKLAKLRLIKRQEIWMLTAQGWITFLAASISSIVFIFAHLYPFLAVTSPIKTADILVVDGWISDYALEQAAIEFKNNTYRQLITIGSPVDQGFYLAEYKNFAEIAAATFQKLGVPKEKIVTVVTPQVIKDRTHASAVTLRQWILNANLSIESINIFTSDAHARRSWIIYKNIFAPQIKVGIIAAAPPNYDANKWWSSSEGVRVIISETIAYIYALFFTAKV
ncbi:YdcF family protein [Halotia branconii]|uniref:ElyC/SanA/YdcF family protein n=1 Tax=Halotia branconii CENA392 TaxID=1539056 RepID=A0AAJ6PC90_9CYAN|nr:ElyC/SanA/YdcF family protein [Halotia branconii]WGV28531.1 ElyC/SanA/YdcF family protein [Halotia branconii CENA392]